MILLVDSREQLPYWVCPQCVRIALHVGDYSTIKLLGKFHIERKSMQDLYGTIIAGHARFRRELIRASSTKTRLIVVVEGSRIAFVKKKFSRRPLKVSSTTLERILATVEQRYNLDIIWIKDRLNAQRYVKRRLEIEETRTR